MSFGRIHCFLVATKAGDVIYERFYDRLSEVEKAEVRAAFQLASSNVRLNDDQDYCGAFKWVQANQGFACDVSCINMHDVPQHNAVQQHHNGGGMTALSRMNRSSTAQEQRSVAVSRQAASAAC